jgi:hypothetical protein
VSLSQRIIQSRDLAESLSFWATAFGILIAVAAGLFTLWQSSRERRHQRLMRARELYDDYLKLSIEYPLFFDNYWLKDDVGHEERERYVCFVAYMLNGVEDILLFDGRNEWRESVKADLRFHQPYLRSRDFNKLFDGYFTPTKEVISEVIAEPDFFEASHA